MVRLSFCKWRDANGDRKMAVVITNERLEEIERKQNLKAFFW